MDINLIERLLDAELAKTKATYVNGACVQTLKKPVLIAETLEQTLNTDEERELYSGTFEAWPGNVHEYLDSQGLRTALFTLAWDGFGPVSWACGVETIDSGRYSYVAFWDEVEGHQLFASVTPAGNAEGLRLIAREAIANGTLVSSVPHNIFNDQPELLERDLFQNAFTDLLDRTDGWGALADDHFGRLVEPNHLQRCLDILSTLPPISDSAALDAWIDEAEGLSDLAPEARRLLLEDVLDTRYEERADR
jgi:hypothetical protein